MIRRLRATARDWVRRTRSRQTLLLLAITLGVGAVWWLAQRDPRLGTSETIAELSRVAPASAAAPGAASQCDPPFGDGPAPAARAEVVIGIAHGTRDPQAEFRA
jgi:hypothetical protein